MPTTTQPTIRAHQEVWEAKGMVQTMDTVAVTQHKADVVAGTKTKVVPKINIWYLGTHTVPA